MHRLPQSLDLNIEALWDHGGLSYGLMPRRTVHWEINVVGCFSVLFIIIIIIAF